MISLDPAEPLFTPTSGCGWSSAYHMPAGTLSHEAIRRALDALWNPSPLPFVRAPERVTPRCGLTAFHVPGERGLALRALDDNGHRGCCDLVEHRWLPGMVVLVRCDLLAEVEAGL